jgi:hypothetical protein
MEEYRTNSPFVKRVSAKQTGYSKSTFGILSDNGHSGKAEEFTLLCHSEPPSSAKQFHSFSVIPVKTGIQFFDSKVPEF